MSVWDLPSPSDFDRLDELLLTGMEPSTAAKQLGFTMSAFRRADRARHAESLDLSREARGHYVDEKVERWVDAPETASDAVKLAWAKRWQPAYAGPNRVEITGADGGPLEIGHEERLTLADVATFAAQLRSRAGVGGGVSGARELLPAPDDDQLAAGDVPARRRT